MRVEAARRFLARAEEAADEPVDLPSSILSKLTIDDVPDGVSIHVGTKKGNVLHMDSGRKSIPVICAHEPPNARVHRAIVGDLRLQNL